MKAELLLSRLQKVRKSGRDEWLACCPAHEDRSPSLAIKQADDGRTLVHCFAGCSFEAVVGAVGLQIEDLFPDKLVSNPTPKRLQFSPMTALKALAFNSTIMAVLASDLSRGKVLSVEDRDKLHDIAQEFREAAHV